MVCCPKYVDNSGTANLTSQYEVRRSQMGDAYDSLLFCQKTYTLNLEKIVREQNYLELKCKKVKHKQDDAYISSCHYI